MDLRFGAMAVVLQEHLKEASVAAGPPLTLAELVICSTT
jgi:hypothetical protein